MVPLWDCKGCPDCAWNRCQRPGRNQRVTGSSVPNQNHPRQIIAPRYMQGILSISSEARRRQSNPPPMNQLKLCPRPNNSSRIPGTSWKQRGRASRRSSDWLILREIEAQRYFTACEKSQHHQNHAPSSFITPSITAMVCAKRLPEAVGSAHQIDPGSRGRGLLLLRGVVGEVNALGDVSLEISDGLLQKNLLLVGDALQRVNGLLSTVGLPI